MIWIFPYIKKRILRGYRNLLRWLFWGLSQKLKRMKKNALDNVCSPAPCCG